MNFLSTLDFYTVFWLIFIIGTTHFVSAITGFGCTMLAMPFLIILVGLPIARPLLVITAILQSLYVVLYTRKYIDWKSLKTILIITVIALPFGYALYSYLPQNVLIIILGFVMIFGGITGLLKIRGIELAFMNIIVLKILMFIGGILQAAFISGGALIVLYTNKIITDKHTLRATLSILWIVLNGITMIQSIATDQFTAKVNIYLLVSLPILFISVWLGNIVANKVSKLFFDYLLNTILIVAGIITILNKVI